MGGQVEVALKVACVDDVDDHVGCVLHHLLSHIQLFGRVGRERIGAGQVDEVEVVAFEGGVTLFGVNGHTAIVAHTLVCAAGKVEE